MSQKVRQLTDNIHDTIFLSSFESEMIATPYFNRLHDIYQNSTVYTAFPSNRTKRYEHSLGTMKIASYMLFSAISNADDDVRSEIFESLKQHFKRILKKIYEEGENVDARYFASYYDEYSALFSSFKNDDDDDESSFDNLYSDTMNEIANALRTNAFVDEALDNYQYYNVNIKNATNDEDGVVDNTESSKSGYMVHEYNIEHIFLYRCLLQALRIVALYHDAGHPPMSHILEDVITNVYEQATMHYKKGEWDSEKLDKCIKSLKPYIKQGSGKHDKCDDEQVRYTRLQYSLVSDAKIISV